MMTKYYFERNFHKDVKIIKFCKVCDVQFFWFKGCQGLCVMHRYVKKLTEERKKYLNEHDRQRKYIWNIEHPEKRRKVALESYHRRKRIEKNRMRKHRATRTGQKPVFPPILPPLLMPPAQS